MASTRPDVRLILEAANLGQVSDVQEILALGADPNASDGSGRTPRHAAARGGHELTVSVLLADGRRRMLPTTTVSPH